GLPRHHGGHGGQEAQTYSSRIPSASFVSSVVESLGKNMSDDLDRELRSHLENEADDQRDRGLSAEAARDAARRALGSATLIKEDVRALSPWAAIDDAAQDVRYGLR